MMPQKLGDVGGLDFEERIRRMARSDGYEIPSIPEIYANWNRKILAEVRRLFGRSVEWHLLIGAQDPLDQEYDMYVDFATGHDICLKCRGEIPSRCPMRGRRVEVFQTRYHRGVHYNEDVYIPVRPPKPNCRAWAQWAREQSERERERREKVVMGSIEEGF